MKTECDGEVFERYDPYQPSVDNLPRRDFFFPFDRVQREYPAIADWVMQFLMKRTLDPAKDLEVRSKIISSFRTLYLLLNFKSNWLNPKSIKIKKEDIPDAYEKYDQQAVDDLNNYFQKFYLQEQLKIYTDEVRRSLHYIDKE